MSRRVLTFSWLYPPLVGGVEEIARAGARGLRARGHEVTVLTAASPIRPPGETDEEGVRVIRRTGLHPADPGSPERVAGIVREALAEHRPHVVHGHLISYPWMPARSAAVLNACADMGVPVVDQAHGGDPWRDASACVTLMRRVAALICDSEHVRRELERLAVSHAPDGRAALPPLRVAYPATASLERFRPDPVARRRVRSSLGVEDRELVVFFPSRFFDVDGRLSTGKRPLQALNAFARMRARGVVTARLLAVRSPGFWTAESEQRARRQIDGLAARLGLDGRILFLDRGVSRAEMASLYAASDVALVPSVEGFGLVYTEAMACGLPTIAVREGAAKEVVGDAGVLVEPGDGLEERLGGALAALAGEPAMRARLGEAARGRIAERFPPERWVEALEDILLGIADRDG